MPRERSFQGDPRRDKEKFYLDRPRIIQELTLFLREEMRRWGVEFSDGQSRMTDIIALPREQVDKIKKLREPLIKQGISHLDYIQKHELISPNFFRGDVSDKSFLVAEALELAIKESNQEKREASAQRLVKKKR